jgi:CRISPR-associated endonuclease/helicase Cas3
LDTEYVAHYIGSDKAGQSVEKHLLEVADLARCFADKIGLSSVGEVEGLLHDLGKYAHDFQAYIRSAAGKLEPDAEPPEGGWRKGKIDHSTAGAQLVWNTVKDHDGVSNLLAQIISLCIASHHSGLIDCLSPDGEGKFLARMSKELEQTHLEEVRDTADREIVSRFRKLVDSPELIEELKNRLKHLLLGEPSSDVREFYVGLLVRFLFSALIDADRLSAADRANEVIKNPRNPDWPRLAERLEHHVAGIPRKSWVDDIRTEVSSTCREFASRDRGLFRLTVPTGGGKTLSSLRFALHHAARHRMDRVIYVIPYISIIDQNAALTRSVLERDQGRGAVVLEHHSNLTPDKQTWQASLLAENWDAQVIFTTSVQFLETLFGGGTRSVRRMHRLANAVII